MPIHAISNGCFDQRESKEKLKRRGRYRHGIFTIIYFDKKLKFVSRTWFKIQERHFWNTQSKWDFEKELFWTRIRREIDRQFNRVGQIYWCICKLKLRFELFCLLIFFFEINLRWKNAWMDQNEHNFNKFKSFYNHFADICGKTRQYLPIKNIHLPENIDFEGNHYSFFGSQNKKNRT